MLLQLVSASHCPHQVALGGCILLRTPVRGPAYIVQLSKRGWCGFCHGLLVQTTLGPILQVSGAWETVEWQESLPIAHCSACSSCLPYRLLIVQLSCQDPCLWHCLLEELSAPCNHRRRGIFEPAGQAQLLLSWSQWSSLTNFRCCLSGLWSSSTSPPSWVVTCVIRFVLQVLCWCY